MSVIPESGMNFGKYDEKDLFHIETSEIYKKTWRWNPNSGVYPEI